jgi:hypothetical protein
LVKKKKEEREFLPLTEKDFKNSKGFFLELSVERVFFLGCHARELKEKNKRREKIV